MEEINARQFVKRNASAILTSLGDVGVIATTVTAVKATLNINRVISANYKRFYGKEMNVMKLKIDGTKALSIGATALAVVGTLLSSKVDSNNRKAMKSEIKEELMKELKTK